jgi:hypothetical protein
LEEKYGTGRRRIKERETFEKEKWETEKENKRKGDF